MFGSSLVNTKYEKVWGEFSLKSDFTQLALPIHNNSISDTVRFDRVEPSRKTNLLGWIWERDSYRQIIEALGTVNGSLSISSQSSLDRNLQDLNFQSLNPNPNSNSNSNPNPNPNPNPNQNAANVAKKEAESQFSNLDSSKSLSSIQTKVQVNNQKASHQKTSHQQANDRQARSKDDNFDRFQFAYDWRRDNAENAQLLNEFILEKSEYLRQEYRERWGLEPAEIKFDIIAHSMGGLLTRYFLLYGDRPLPDQGPLPEITWAGARYVDRVILLGPPNGGTLETLVQLTQGKFLNPPKPGSDPLMNLGSWLGKVGIGPGKPDKMVATWGTFPSLYQMLPRTRHQSVLELSETKPPTQTAANLFDLSLWERMHWGLLSPKSDPVLRYLLPDVVGVSARQAIARQYLSRCLKRAERFTQALDRPASLPDGLNLQLIAGDGFLTPAVVAIDPKGKLKMVQQGPGDGVVLRRNALLEEQLPTQQQSWMESPIAWSRISFYVQEHAKLVRDTAILNNLLFTLLEEPRFVR
ncbi:MAG: hypothetical protein HC771_02630 [Synechococcales cyanobacterium CRU_2_2]|nr:hypothetical protein [Synechococcales cyanobacterium CRU_2_2]